MSLSAKGLKKKAQSLFKSDIIQSIIILAVPPSILAKTLPPSTMGSGWRGNGDALLNWWDFSLIPEIEI
jgi:hypothetical protein